MADVLRKRGGDGRPLPFNGPSGAMSGMLSTAFCIDLAVTMGLNNFLGLFSG